MPLGSRHRQAAELVPDDVIMSEEGFPRLVKLIEETYRPYAEEDLEITMEEALYLSERAKNETFA
eukprot:2659930-Alexandrium_andersonii.AAC.1